MSRYDGLQELYVDRLLAASDNPDANSAGSPRMQGLGVFGGEYSLTFFPEARLLALAAQLGHDRVSDVRAKVANVIAERMRIFESVPAPAADSDRIHVFGTDEGSVANYVQTYFDNIHPIYNFLERSQFDTIALGPDLNNRLTADKSWSALFYAVLALGSQYHDGGSYQPAKTVSWQFFTTALALFPDLLITKATLATVQALAAMAIFASNIACLQIEYAMVSEGAKKAQALGYNRTTAPGHDPRNRTFWVLYFLEKNMTFSMGRSSSIMDSDICSAILSEPLKSDSISFDWTLASIRIARLLSRIYASLYSVSVRGKSSEYYNSIIRNLKSELEAWRVTVPLPLQPGHPIRQHAILTPQLMDVRIRSHYLYHGTTLHLDRTKLQFAKEENERSEIVTDIMKTARTVLELTKYIDVQPYTPLWVLAGTPLAAFLVLFDLVIDNPTHPETTANLALLDVGSGHFSGIEYASQGTLPGSIASEFTQIARAYVREKSGPGNNTTSRFPALPSMEMPSTADASGSLPSEASLNFSPFTYRPPVPPDTIDGMIPGTDILDMFGSYFPTWDPDFFVGNMSA
ncbi:Nn.00g072420.m01.CDS01 [Neocucurbitaria sp. VM-36]